MLQLPKNVSTGEREGSTARGGATLSHVMPCARVPCNGEYLSKFAQDHKFSYPPPVFRLPAPSQINEM